MTIVFAGRRRFFLTRPWKASKRTWLREELEAAQFAR
jgi:hypothetical protein